MKQKAFTLIELSIVLVIIGLIVGGVLVGKDLIQAAKIRQTISQKEKFDTAVQTFKLKYNCLPGDCNNASSFGFGSGWTYGGGNPNGNGDGVVCVTRNNALETECINFWYHLYQSNLTDITFQNALVPNNARCITPGFHSPPSPITKQEYVSSIGGCGGTGGGYRGGWVVMDLDAMMPQLNDSKPGLTPWAPIPFVGRAWSLTAGNANWGGLHAPTDYRMIDEKIDDGLPLSGTVFAAHYEMRYNDPFLTLSQPASNCVSGGKYVNSSTPISCPLYLKAAF